MVIKVVSEHKDIVKMHGQLNSLIGSLKIEFGKVLDRVEEAGDFTEIWKKDAESKLKDFVEHDPSLAEYQDQIRFFRVSCFKLL